jgi:hypothetical protein
MPKSRELRNRILSWTAAIILVVIGVTTSTVFTQTQSNCTSFTFNPPSASYSASGGSGSVTCTKNNPTNGVYTACPWIASSNDSWITITSGVNSDATGFGVVMYTVAANTSSAARTGTITVSSGQYGSAVYSITQAGISVPFQAAPASLFFAYFLGGPVPSGQTVTLTGPAFAGYSIGPIAAAGGPWLFAGPGGTLNSSGLALMTVSVANAGLPPGTYHGSVPIRDVNLNTTATIAVTLTVNSGVNLTIQVPKVEIFSYRLDNPGRLPPSQPYTVVSPEGPGVGFGVSPSTFSSKNWLSVDRTSGVTPATLQISVDPTGLPQGSYLGLISVQAFNFASNTINGVGEVALASGASSQATTAVILTIGPQSPLIATPESFTLDSQTPNMDVQVTAGTKLSVVATALTIDGPPDLLTLNRTNGTTNTIFTVGVNSANQQTRPFFGVVTILDPGSGAGRVVQVNVNQSPTGIGSDTDSLTFTGDTGGLPPAPQSITITTPTPVSASVSSDSPWLSVRPSTFTTPAVLSVTANPANLAANEYAGQLLISTGADTLNVPVGFNLQSPPAGGPNRQIVSQIADGSGWKTTITLVNNDVVSAGFTLNFWNADGSPLTLPLSNGTNVSQYRDTIPLGGARTISTGGTGSALLQGWVEIVSTQLIGGFAIFRQQVVGRQDFEAVSPVVPNAGGDFLLPFDNTQKFVTSMAIVNPASISTNVKVRLWGQNGNLLGNYDLPMGARSRLAFALTDRFSAATNTVGVAEFQSDQSGLAGLGLRFNPGGAFTSLPVLTLNDTAGNGRRWLSAQIADGLGWKTSITVVNGDVGPATALLNFNGTGGAPASFTFDGIGASSALQAMIPASTSASVSTTGTGGALTQAWLAVGGARALGGFAVFRQAVPGRPDFEAASPLVRYPANGFLLPFDNTQQFVTSMALVNSSSAPATIAVTLRGEEGNMLSTSSISLPAFGQTAFALQDRFTGIQNLRGVAEFFSLGGVSGLGLRFNPGGAFTSLPIVVK